jgi:hypothetical protein
VEEVDKYRYNDQIAKAKSKGSVPKSGKTSYHQVIINTK